MQRSDKPRAIWSIGIYCGNSPLSLKPPSEFSNPVLRAADISDARAEFVADPFVLIVDSAWHMFFEVMNLETGRGEIGRAESEDGLRWNYAGMALREPFHLSYPLVFKWGDNFYMIPETLGAEAICLYRADALTSHWRREAVILSGRYADPTVFRAGEYWWMFATPRHNSRNDALDLFFSADLHGPWRLHPRSPIITADARSARPAGRVTDWNGRLFRFAQDCLPHYGTGVRVFEIDRLSPSDYAEHEIPESPMLGPGEEDWNREGMHHIDPHPTPEGKWIATVDGWVQSSESNPCSEFNL